MTEPSLEVIGGGHVELARVLELTAIPQELESSRLILQSVPAEPEVLGDEEALRRRAARLARLLHEADKIKNRLSVTPPILFSAEVVCLRGVGHSQKYLERKERVESPSGSWHKTIVDDITEYPIVCAQRSEALRAINGSRGYFWQGEQQRLGLALIEFDKVMRVGWSRFREYNDDGTSVENNEEVLRKLGLLKPDMLFIDLVKRPFRVDPNNIGNNGYPYVRPRKRHPRPLDLTWSWTFHEGSVVPAVPDADEVVSGVIEDPRKPQSTPKQNKDQGNLF